MNILTSAFSLNMFGIKEPPQASDELSMFRVRFETVLEDDVRGMVKRGDLRSAIGHDGTAKILSERLGVDIAMNRIDVQFPAMGVESLVVAQIATRVPPGVELSADQVRDLSIVYWQITEILV